jgi:hypothetical protein
MQSRPPLEYFLGTVLRVVVQERPAASQFILKVREFPAAACVFVVPAPNRERDSATYRHDNAGRPNLDVQFDWNARPQGLQLIVSVVGPPPARFRPIQLSV